MDDVSTGELSRRLDALDRNIDFRLTQAERNNERRLNDINASIRELQFVHKDVYAADQRKTTADNEAFDARLTSLEESRINWPKLLATAIISPAIVGIILLLIPILLK